jgi:hypothetical protein
MKGREATLDISRLEGRGTNMPNQPKPEQRPAEAKGERKTTPGAGAGHAETLSNAYADWTRGQQEAALEYQKRCHDAYYEFVRQLHQASASAQKPMEESYRKLATAAQAAQQDKEKWQDYQNAYQQFASSYGSQSSDETQDIFRKAYESFQQAQREAAEAAQQRFAEGHQKFVRALKTVWNEVDPQKVDPNTMRLIEWATSVASAARV